MALPALRTIGVRPDDLADMPWRELSDCLRFVSVTSKVGGDDG